MLDRLDRWADDPEVRVIGVTGIGGVGKTALVGHWLKQRGGDTRRDSAGLFYWSFYADRDVESFLEGLLEFAQEELGRAEPADDVRPVDAARELLREAPLLLVLDGLEVLQERPGTSAYGELLEGDLRELLDAACRAKHGLVALTSRFPFADLSPYAGLGFRSLDVDRLTPDEGAALLGRCEVGGTAADRGEVSQRLDGHPLALRVFAAALATQADGDPTRLCEVIFEQADVSEGDPLKRKLGRLLAFYEQNLPPERTALLGIVSLFRTPVREDTINTLARRLPTVSEALANVTDKALRAELDALRDERLLLRERDEDGDAYSCHPVLRDHFRQALLARDESVASEAADFLTDQPAADRPRTVREVEPVLEAIEVLLEAGDFRRADELYAGRLEHGVALRRLPALHEGLRCALGFVANDERQTRCEEQLSKRWLSFYLNEVALFAHGAGEPRRAVRFYAESEGIDRQYREEAMLSIGLTNRAELLVHLGEPAEAECAAHEALAWAGTPESGVPTYMPLACLGHTLIYRASVAEAMEAFQDANQMRERNVGDGGELQGLAGVAWAELLLRLGRRARARQLTDANLRISERNNCLDDVARCHWILGRLDTAEGRLDAAAEQLAEAEATMRRGHMLTELPWVLVAQADLRRRGQRAWDEALRYAGEALRIAGPRELRLAHADALVVRGRIHLDCARAEGEPESEETRWELFRAQDDGNAALSLARECEYAWAERDAVELLAEACEAVGEEEGAVAHRREAEALSRRLQVDAEE